MRLEVGKGLTLPERARAAAGTIVEITEASIASILLVQGDVMVFLTARGGLTFRIGGAVGFVRP